MILKSIMKSILYGLFVLATISTLSANTSSLEEVPVLYKGRYRPMEVYAKLWLYEVYHQQHILKEHHSLFHTDNGSALEFLWRLSKEGHEKWDSAPLFWIKSAELKQALGLNIEQKRFSFSDLQIALTRLETTQDIKELPSLTHALQIYKEGPFFLGLPDKKIPNLWQPLSRLQESFNFTTHSKDQFEKIRSAYLEHNDTALAKALKQAYRPLEGKAYQQAWGKSLTYPTAFQLKAELLYMRYPTTDWTALGYGLALILLILGWTKAGSTLAVMSFTLHTMILLTRVFILQRPPVSNMFETVIYVPWISVLASFIFSFSFKNRIPLIASCGASMALLILLKIADLNPSLENVQAVLDSQYWLIIHVLMIVGSYGVFILSAVLGHFYLIGIIKAKTETPFLASLAKCILHSMYLGTALLIPGTILGGIWAAESWGRFWDWDPKESWAFISACIYILFIHAHRFHHIANIGLAIGSIVGVLAVSFTWYGVNYILGTGLHSYGFGNGGEGYYYAYLLGEGVFLLTTYILAFRLQLLLKSN